MQPPRAIRRLSFCHDTYAMTPAQMARLHRAAFTLERPWSAAEFSDLLQNPHVTIVTRPHGFALIRTVAGESELLTLAVDPAYQRQGTGRALTQDWLNTAQATAQTAFLEVAADNTAALALYHQIGFAQIATRSTYYARKNAAPADALILQMPLPFRQTLDKPAETPESG